MLPTLIKAKITAWCIMSNLISHLNPIILSMWFHSTCNVDSTSPDVKLWFSSSNYTCYNRSWFQNQNYFYTSVSILYLNQIFYFILSSSLRDRDRADTIITFHHPPTYPPTHHKLFKDLRVDLYSSVIHHWNRQLKTYWFPIRKNRVN